MARIKIFEKIILVLSIVAIVGILIVPGAAIFVMDQYDQTYLTGTPTLATVSIASNKPSDCSTRCFTDSACYYATFVKAGTSGGSTAKCIMLPQSPGSVTFHADMDSIFFYKRDTAVTATRNPAFCSVPPTASFTVSPLKGFAPLTVQFTDGSSNSGSWYWDFNDDGIYDSYEKNPSYIYKTPGTYTVQLTIGGAQCFGEISGAFQTETKADVITVQSSEGSLEITSEPTGAKVYVDTNYKGVTPKTVTGLTAGTHAVRFNMSGYKDQTMSVTVTAGTLTAVSAILEQLPEGSPCEDGNLCTINDVIKNGVCTSGTPKPCDDQNPNTVDTCNAATGACTSTIKPEGSLCDDGNQCTVNDVMKGGVCTAGTPLVCNDENSKTADTCDPKTGCVYTPLKPMTISFTSSVPTVEPNNLVNLVITVLGNDSAPIAGATVELSQPQGTAVNPLTGITNSSGMISSVFIPSEEGTYTITATVGKDGYLTGSQTITLTVKSVIKLMDFLPFILLIVIIVIIVLFLLTRNRLQLIVKSTSVPADGRSTIPVKVQFANGLGSPKNQSVDRDVNLTATSGTIKPVLIARGKAFAETMLTASREVGKVKVAAQYGNQQAEAMVTFTIEGGTIEITSTPMELPADGKSAAMITLKLKDKGNIPISFMDEKTMQVTTTLGTITGTIKIPPRATEVKTSLMSGTSSGIAVITGMVDQFKGETSVRIGAVAERHCQRCGTKVSMEAILCPNCKQSPTIPDKDTKQCPFCKEELPKTAVYCNKCGRNQA